MKQQEGLIKSKQELLDGLIEQQKQLVVKLEKGKGIMKVNASATARHGLATTTLVSAFIM